MPTHILTILNRPSADAPAHDPAAPPYRFADPDVPQLSMLDLGATRGDGIFETISVFGGRPQALEHHLSRFAISARKLDLPAPVSAGDLAEPFALLGGVEWWNDLGNGVIKSLVFGVTVSFVALYQGYMAQPTPEGVSRATTRTVVVASLAVLALDFVLTAMMFSI